MIESEVLKKEGFELNRRSPAERRAYALGALNILKSFKLDSEFTILRDYFEAMSKEVDQ